MSFVKVNGAEIFYEQMGKSGPPLILVSGLSVDHSTWLTVAPLLSRHFQVLLYDNRAVGDTVGDFEGLTTDIMANDLAVLLERLDINNPIILGHSMGGAIAQRFAIDHPEVLQKLILVNTFSKGDMVAELYMNTIFELLAGGVPFSTLIDLHFTRIYGHEFLMQTGRVAMAKLSLLSEAGKMPPAEMYHAHANASLLHDTSKSLAKIKTDTTIISGDEDLMIPTKYSRYLHKYIPNSEYIELKAVGHIPQIEKPELFVKTVLKVCESQLSDYQ